MGMRLTSTNPCSCLTLTQIPHRNHSRMEKGECESSLLARVWVQFEVLARVLAERVWRDIYTSPPEKEPLGSGLPGDSGYKPGNSGTARFHTLKHGIRRLRATGSGVSGAKPGVSGFGRTQSQVLFFWVVPMVRTSFSRFTWAQVLDQNLWTKSILIVRCSYTQISNIKTNFLSILEQRLFIPFSRGHVSTIDLPVQPHHLHTCLITQLNIHVFCHLSPKPT